MRMIVPQHSIWKFGLGVLDIDTKVDSLELKEFKDAPWKGIILYGLILKLSSNRGLALFIQKQILRSARHKNLQKKNNVDFLKNIPPFIE